MAEAARWSIDVAREVATDACRQAGVAPGELPAIRFAKNALFTTGTAGPVVRVDRPGAWVSSWLPVVRAAAAGGVPVLLPLDDREPIRVRDCHVTFWPVCTPSDPATVGAWLGRTLRQLHDHASECAAAGPDLVDLVPRELDSMAARILTAGERNLAGPATIDRLTERLADVEMVLRGRPWTAPVVLHGDAHSGNVLTGPAGGRVLADFDHSGLGPALWEQMPLTVEVRRFGRDPAQLDHFRRAYAAQGADDDAHDALLALRELKVATYAIGRTDVTRRDLDEVEHRVASLPDGSQRWSFR